MNDIAEIVRDAEGDRGIRGVYEPFTHYQMNDFEIDAAAWATLKFYPTFPGYQLLRCLRGEVGLFDDELDAWVVGGAYLLARSSLRRGGRPYIAERSRGPWIAQAARDGFATFKRLSGARGFDSFVLRSADARAVEFGMRPATWRKIYLPITAMLWTGFREFENEALHQYTQAKVRKLETGCNVSLGKEPLDFSRLWYGPQAGNVWAPKRGSGNE